MVNPCAGQKQVGNALGGGSFAQGALAAGLPEALQEDLAALSGDNDAMQNLLSTIIGGAVGGTQGALAAGNADKFNRQLHPTEIDWARNSASDYAQKHGISEEAALSILVQELLRGVSDDYAHVSVNSAAREYIEQNADVGAMVDNQTLFSDIANNATRKDEYENSLMNFGTAVKNSEVYENIEIPLFFGSNQNGAPMFGENNNILTLSEAASRDANYFGRPGDAVTDWDSKGDDSAAAWASLSEAIGRMAIAAQTGEGLPEGMTPKRASALAEAYSMSALNTSMILELGSTREERAAALDQMSDDQLAAVLIGQGTTTDQVLDMVEGNKSIRQGIAHLRKTLKETLSNIDKPNPNPQNQVNNNGGKDDVGAEAANGRLPDNGIDYNIVSTASNGQRTAPANLQEQSLWNGVVENPTAGRPISNANNDPRFRPEDGFQKMEMTTVSDTGQRTTIHYQYNSNTREAYDIKIDYPR